MTPRQFLTLVTHPATRAEFRKCCPMVVIVGVFLFGLALFGPERW